MNVIIFIIPIALLLGFIGLVAFVWALKSGQFDDLDGAAVRILDEELEERPIQEPVEKDKSEEDKG